MRQFFGRSGSFFDEIGDAELCGDHDWLTDHESPDQALHLLRASQLGRLRIPFTHDWILLALVHNLEAAEHCQIE